MQSATFESEIDQVSLSETSDVIDTCICSGALQDRKAICCDNEECRQKEKWFHAYCLKFTKQEWKRLEEDDSTKWYCPDCVK